METTSKVSMQIGSANLTAEGSEEFVRDAIGLWREVIAAPIGKLADLTPTPLAQKNAAAEQGLQSGQVHGGKLEAYSNVFDSVDGQLKIIANVPGKNKAELTRSVALLVLFGHHLQGAEQISVDFIRQACIDQGCYDNTNFAGYLKSLKSRVVMNTKQGGGYDVKLTAPGRKDGKELADQLQVGQS